MGGLSNPSPDASAASNRCRHETVKADADAGARDRITTLMDRRGEGSPPEIR